MVLKDDIMAQLAALSSALALVEEYEPHPCGAESEFEIYVKNVRSDLTALTEYVQQNL